MICGTEGFLARGLGGSAGGGGLIGLLSNGPAKGLGLLLEGPFGFFGVGVECGF